MNLPTDPAVERFLAHFADALHDSSFVKLVLAKPQRASDDLLRLTARLVLLRGEAALSLVYTHKTRDITKNHGLHEGVALLRELLGSTFRNAHLHTQSEEWQLSISKKGQCTLHVAAASHAADAPTAHDREKQRWLELTRPFLTELGVTTAQHQLIPAMSRKWKQINKFIEVFAHALASSPLADVKEKAKQLNVIDFGSGKGYLTFAIHDWLRHSMGVNAQVTGVELRPDMVA
ncbi:MAG: methyltransferase, partial [Cytophagales bacterium]|nr:methyltransferase [Rhizobacter sp.]